MIRTKYELKRRHENVSVEMDAEFVENITHKYYNFRDIYDFFSRYKFNEFVNDFRNEYNCHVKCSSAYFLYIVNKSKGIFFDKFLTSTLNICNRNDVDFFALPAFINNGGNPSQEASRILQQKELYTEVRVSISMEVIFFLSYRLGELSTYERAERHMGRTLTEYEIEQLEDLEDNIDCYSDEDDSVKSPFVTDKCCICLNEKPEIVLVPCLHKSVCLQCEEEGKLRKCPTCRRKITKKIKI